jgi:hypothetical protein
MTILCERALVSFLGSAGPWSDRIYLVGGLAPRYIVGRLPDGVPAHVGTTDVDLVVAFVVDDESEEAYWTLATNLKNAGFEAVDSCRWAAKVDGVKVTLEFLCDTDSVGAGSIFKPKGQKLGTKLGAFNIPGASLAALDYRECEIEADRVDGTGRSRVTLRVIGLLPFVVLKIRAYQDRHDNKDAYDLIFCLLNYGEGPEDGAVLAAASSVHDEPMVVDGLRALEERFKDVDCDGPGAYSAFHAEEGDVEAAERFRREAVATVRQFLAKYRELVAESGSSSTTAALPDDPG